MHRRIIISFLFLCFIPLVSTAQQSDTTSLFSIGLRFHRSFIIQHTQKLSEAVTSSNPWMIEADFNWHLRKPDTREYCNCYPRTGISLHYVNFDLPQILGDALSVYAFIEPYIMAEKKLNYSVRFGLGPSILSQLYDEEDNPDNRFFSSTVSFLALLSVNVNYRINPKLTLHATGSFNHISNGGYSEPNLGMNFPSVSIGADYSFRDIVFPSNTNYSTGTGAKHEYPDKNRIEVITGFSAKPTTSGLNEKRYPVYVLGVNYGRTIAKIVALNGGMEWVNDRSIYHSLREKNLVNEDGEYEDHSRIGLLAGVDWLFGRFVFYQHLGIYVYSPVKAESKVYQRYGLNFKITEHIFAGINIKAHGQDADFMDVRIGYSW